MNTVTIPDPTNDLCKLRPCVINRVDEPIDRSEVFRYLGYPVGVTPKNRIGNIIDHWHEAD